jgi:hypothetical protein
MKKSLVRFATVKFFDPKKKFGYAILNDGGRELYLKGDNGPLKVTLDENGVLFADVRKEHQKVNGGDQIAVYLGSEGPKTKITHWSMLDDWNAAQDYFNRLPVYRVLRDNIVNGETTRVNEVITQGNLGKIIRKFPRDGYAESAMDQIAPVYRIGPITARNRFEVKDGGEWKKVSDPRPLPNDSVVYRLVHWKNDRPHILAEGSMFEMSCRFPAESQELKKYERVIEGKDFVYWLRKTGDDWTEVGDPRVFIDPKLRQAKAQAAQVRPAPAQAAANRKPFSQKVNSFAELALLL